MNRLARLCGLFSWPVLIRSLRWPVFSLTSHDLVGRLVAQGLQVNTLLDAGANIGQFSVAAHELLGGPEIHAFEPNPVAAERFRRNTRRYANIHLHPIALGDRSDRLDFQVNRHSHSSSLLPLGPRHLDAFPDARIETTMVVEVRRLDDLLADLKLPPPVLLKLDVQGYETQVLRGAGGLLGKIDHILLEVSFEPLYQGEIVFLDLLPMLDQLGFEFLRPVGWLEHPATGQLLQMDALFRRKAAKPNDDIR